MQHPNLDPRICALMEKSEKDGGIWTKDLTIGDIVKVQTQNRIYTITCTGEAQFTIQGHPRYCPAPVKANIHGSTWGGSMLKVGFIGNGMWLEFSVGHGPVTTTQIKSVVMVQPTLH